MARGPRPVRPWNIGEPCMYHVPGRPPVRATVRAFEGDKDQYLVVDLWLPGQAEALRTKMYAGSLDLQKMGGKRG